MLSRCCEFVDSRLRRSPPDRASAVPYGQAGENAMRFPRLAHRSAAAHKLHSTPQQHRMNLISGNDQTSSRLPAFSLLLPESCPNNRDRGRSLRSKRAGSSLVDTLPRLNADQDPEEPIERKYSATTVPMIERAALRSVDGGRGAASRCRTARFPGSPTD